MTLRDFAEELGRPGYQVIKKMLDHGVLATLNHTMLNQEIAWVTEDFAQDGIADQIQAKEELTKKEFTERIRELRLKHISAMKAIIEKPTDIPLEAQDDVDELLSLIEAEEEAQASGGQQRRGGPRG